MTTTHKLSIETLGDTEIVVKRRFDAPPEAVYRAHTDPELIRQWMLGPEGWSMPVCISEARPGGKIRYEWRNDSGEATGEGEGFFMTGEYLELDPPRRIVHVERMQLPDAETRKAMLDTGMAMGMEASYDRIDGLFG